MFEHSTKVPRHYKIAANILKKVSTDGGSLKSLIYDAKLRHYRLNVLYALITCAIRNAEALKRIFLDCQIFEKEPRLDPWLARILTVEILMGKKSLPGHSKPEQTLLQYNEQIQSYACKHPEFFDSRGPRRPRYVRVNTIELGIEDFISSFENEGYRFIPCTTGSYNDYLAQVQNLEEGDFLQDYHVKVMFAFHTDTKFHDHEWVLDGKILLQDKATSMSVHLLAPEQRSVVLDMCAAPGMKTTQIAAAIQCKGLVYAVERNAQRYQTLVEFIKKTNSHCVEALHLDAFDIRQHTMDTVEYILLDPSCSGSGMDHHVHSYGDNDGRLESLTSMQEKLLKHAMNSFPNAKRIVYSTCSLLPEENERVVKNVIKSSRSKWEVQDVKNLLKGQWNNFGSGQPGSLASKCLYAKPESDLTTGFFLAVIDRKLKDLNKTNHPIDMDNVKNMEVENKLAEPFIKNSKKSDKNEATNDLTQAEEIQVEEVSESNNQEDENKVERKTKSKKKRKTDGDGQLINSISDNLSALIMEEEEIPEKRRNKDNQTEVPKKKKREENVDEIELTEEIQTESKSTSKKQKRKKNVDENDLPEEIQTESNCAFERKKSKKNVGVNELTEEIQTESKSSSKKKKRKKNVDDYELMEEIQSESAIKKDKRKKNVDENELTEEIPIETGSVSKKKKRKKNVDLNELTEDIKIETGSASKKKKRRKNVDLNEQN